MSLESLAKQTGIRIVGERKKKRGTFDSLVEAKTYRDKLIALDPLNYWDKVSIMFSTDVNSIADSVKKGKKQTKFNRKNYMKIIKSCIAQTNIRYGKNGVKAYSLSQMNGCYVGENGNSYEERIVTLELLGLPNNIGEFLAMKVRESFCQESVMFIVGEKKKLLY